MTKTPVATAAKAPAIHENQLPEGFNLDELAADAALNPQLTSNDVALPYIVVLQGLSPQVNAAKTQHIMGAQAGMFYNTVSGEIYEGRQTGLMIVPCAYERRLVQWKHRDTGGGYVKDFPPDSDIMNQTQLDDKGKPRLPNGDVMVETAYHYCFVQHPETGAWFEAIIALASTGLKTNRKWNNLITTSKIPGTETQAPRFLYPYGVTTEIQSKGENSWFIPSVVKIESPVSVSVYKQSREFARLINSGAVQRSAPPAQADGGEMYDSETGEVVNNKRQF